MSATAREIPISLIRGGTFYRVQEKARLIRPRKWDLHRRLPLAIAVAWLPLLVLAASHGGFEDVRAVLVDYRVHARVFIAIPLLLVGQITMETRFREMAQHFLDANIVRIEELSRFRAIMQKTRRLRDAWLPEVIVFIAAYVQAFSVLRSGRLRFASWAIDAGSQSLTPAGYYSMLVVQVLFLGLLAIVFWKWAIWVFVLHRLSRLNLQLDATNGDLTGGLGFLAEVPRAFVPVVVAVSAVVGSAWRVSVLNGQATLDDLIWPAVVFAAILVAIFFLPLTLFTPALLREKRAGTLKYGSLQHKVSLQFRQKWAGHRHQHPEELLGAPDVSSLADASSAFKNVEQMVTYPFRIGTIAAFAAAFAVPLLPVVTTQIPIREVLKGLFDAIR